MNHELYNNGNGKKILFANFPADGHFNPLTGLAVHLKSIGYDVRWYSSNTYAAKIEKLNIPHYPFKRAMDISEGDVDKVFPQRAKLKSQVAKLKFDIVNAFILRGPEYYADIIEVYKVFSFDLLIADVAFTGIPFVKEIMGIPVVSIGVFPLTETSKDLPPAGLGIEPSYSLIGKIKQAILRKFATAVIFREPNKVLHQVFDEYNIPHNKESVFDTLAHKSNLLLQSGTPCFEYFRSDLSKNVRFIGPLLPYSLNKQHNHWFDNRLHHYERIVLLTQGTVEKDVNKIIIPTLEAFKNSNTLVICTTGGSQTEELKRKYPYKNIIIEDFIPFADVMPYTDVYITNGGYGGVMLGIQNNLPMVVAGVHEGKNEICARIGYFKLGVNLKTEMPTAANIRTAVNTVINDNIYRENVEKLSEQFTQYDPNELCAKYVAELTQKSFFKRERNFEAVN